MYLNMKEIKKYFLYSYIMETILRKKPDLVMIQRIACAIKVNRGTQNEGVCLFKQIEFTKAPEILVNEFFL
jgi:hypothetical protein